MAHRARGPRRHHDPAGHLQRGVRAGRGARASLGHGRGPPRPDLDPLRDTCTESTVPAAHSAGRRAVVPGLLRARCGKRSRQREDAGRPRRGRVGGHRTEGLDVAGAPGGLVLRGVPHRPGLLAPQRAVLFARANGPAGGRDSTDHPAHENQRVQRGLLRRRPHRRLQRRGRRRRRLARRAGDTARSSAASPCSGTSWRSGASSTGSSASPRRTVGLATRCCGTVWRRLTSS